MQNVKRKHDFTNMLCIFKCIFEAINYEQNHNQLILHGILESKVLFHYSQTRKSIYWAFGDDSHQTNCSIGNFQRILNKFDGIPFRFVQEHIQDSCSYVRGTRLLHYRNIQIHLFYFH